MSTEQICAEFEKWWHAPEQHELRISCAKGWGFRIWQASREVLVVKLPGEPFYPDGDIDCPLAVNLDDVKSACIGVGINLIVRGEK